MKTQQENTKNKKVNTIFAQKDVLGQDKPIVSSAKTGANPNRIFIVLGILLVATIIYLAFNK